MKPDKPFILFLFLICLSGRLAAQSPFPFGTTSMSDMEMTEYDQDKDAPAVYLFDWCSATLSANNDLSLTVQKHFRIKILKQEGLDYALLKIQFSGSHPPTKLKASTFNLEDGKMVESPVNKKEMFTEKYGNYNRLSLAFNNVKIGSVIECSYTISYDSYFFFYPWSFQHDIPVAYSEYNASFPGLFRYKIEGHYDNINVSLHQDKRPAYYGSLSTQELIYKWTAGNVPAFKPEPYMASENDLISRVEFELAGVDIPGYGYQEATPTYEKLTKELLEDDNFGGIMQKSEFLREITNKITSGLTDNLSKIKAIHRYITQNVKWNEENRIYATATSFRRILKQQNGSSADINLLFTAMLQKAGITSCPVVLSTRENGNLNHYFAMISRLDYVVAYAKIEGKGYLLDATSETRPFNELPPQCLNGEGRTIHPNWTEWIPLHNNEQQYDQVLIFADLNGNNEMECRVQRIFGSYSAYNIRNLLQETGKEGFIAFLKASEGDKEYSEVEILNQDSIESSLVINYKVIIKGAVQSTSGLYIIDPVLFFAKNENPFTGSERKFPVDFESPKNELYTLNIRIPDEFEADELPDEVNLKMENNAAVFNYIPEVNGNRISLSYRFTRKSTHFPVENYFNLKEFYNQFIKKQSDLIILKRKSAAVANNL
jgi:transglutaminase-like putative cysteine protease